MNQETDEIINQIEAEQLNEADRELEDSYKRFEESTSDFDPDQEEPEDLGDTNIFNNKQKKFENHFKVQMFIGIFFFLMDSLHAFVYQMFSKYKIDHKELSLDIDEREGLDMYFHDPRVTNFINKLNPMVLGVLHMEYLYFQKFRQLTEKLDSENIPLNNQNEAIEEVEEAEEEIEEAEENISQEENFEPDPRQSKEYLEFKKNIASQSIEKKEPVKRGKRGKYKKRKKKSPRKLATKKEVIHRE